jgi:UDP-N-acetylmuramoylalanine--D-glutamate ligase
VTAFSVAGQKVTVVGAARSGLAAARLLAGRGANVTLSESRPEVADAASLEAAGVRLELGGHQRSTFVDADLIVMSPGIPPEVAPVAAARTAGVPVISEIELAARWLTGRVIAITGTKGKSTTTTLAGRMLEAAGFEVTVGGNIGTPLSDQVERSTPKTMHVVEVSSFQLELIDRFKPWIAVMLNFSPDHLNRHATVESYGAAKARVFENQTGDDWMVINADDPATLALARAGRARRRMFSHQGSADAWTQVADGWITSGGERRTRLVPLTAIHLIGRHLVDDVMCAATVAEIAGVSAPAMTRAVDGFRGLEHAMELVGVTHGVRFVNDSKATNVEAALKSIESFDQGLVQGLVPIMGGQFKGGDLGLLREPLRARAKAVVAIGESRDRFVEAFAGVVPVTPATSIGEAVRTAFALAQPEGVVLLAPACASFDMFRDYADRGRQFKKEVLMLL